MPQFENPAVVRRCNRRQTPAIRRGKQPARAGNGRFIGRVCRNSTAQVSAELISDGLHSHPAAVRFAFQVFGAARIVLISDSLRCCGMPDGELELGGQKAYLSGGVARLADGTLAGSATNVYECMLRAISFGIPREDAVRAATWNPARQLGCLDEVGSIENGKVADYIICDANLARKEIYLAGKKL